MLLSLNVSNYILIGSLETSFPEGLVIVSGETGAGKSILLGALSLVLGARADASMVGPLGDHCVVEAVFRVDDADTLAFLTEQDIPLDQNRLVLRRTVSRSGRSRSFAGDEPVTVDLLLELSGRLIDIHSQHQTLRLADDRFRMEALDVYAGSQELRSRCTAAWNEVLTARRTLSSLEERARRAEADRDYNQAQWEKLAEARLVPGELEELEAEQKQLAHAEEIKETLCAVENLLSPDSDGLAAPAQQLREAGRLLTRAGQFIPPVGALVERLESARLELEDIADEVSAANARLEASPQRLEQVEERLSLLYGLLRKHGAATLEELMAERDRLDALLQDAGNLGTEVEAARKALHRAEEAHRSLSAQLHGQREKATEPFARAVTEQLRSLELERAAFAVVLEPMEAGATGEDLVRFRFSANGGAPTDLAKAASGGELSRVMLAIKAVMAVYQKLPTLVFDEIDTGVSGSAADKMGSLVCRMGQHMQVFAITHLPQVAAKGNAHYLVEKRGGETFVKVLDAEGRVQELARMLSGAAITPAAVANARELLSQ